jgi:16S rRNA pseudouridine516 synthase
MAEIQRLDKVLGNLGYGTRKEIKKFIKDGIIEVDGRAADDPGMHVNPETQSISVNGKDIGYKKFIYIMLNKPDGVISATEDNREETVLDILPDEYFRFNPSPVGRLDKDTVGLLLLTNDGSLAHMLLSPKKHVPKVYRASIQGEVTQEDVKKFKDGVTLDDGYKTMPAVLNIVESGENSVIEVEIFEGKYHQVKRMFESVGKKVIFLERLSMGPLTLDRNLNRGESRELTDEELNSLIEYTNR